MSVKNNNMYLYLIIAITVLLFLFNNTDYFAAAKPTPAPMTCNVYGKYQCLSSSGFGNCISKPVEGQSATCTAAFPVKHQCKEDKYKACCCQK